MPVSAATDSTREAGGPARFLPGRPLLHSRACFGIRGAPAATQPLDFGCGCSSGVEHDLAKVGVEGSNPFARSKQPSIKSGFLGLFGHQAPASPYLNMPRTAPICRSWLGTARAR